MIVNSQNSRVKESVLTVTAENKFKQKVTIMINVIPDSASVILSATHILLICIEASEPGKWLPAPSGGVICHSNLTLKLEEVLKGSTHEKPGDRMRVMITKCGTGTSRIAAVPGVWSNQPIDPGTRIVAFCRSKDNVVAEMLKDPLCEKLFSADDALDDVRITLEAEDRNLGLQDLIQQAIPSASSLGLVFAEYCWTKYASSVMEKPEDFEALMQFIGDIELSYITRATLMDAVYSRIIASPDIPAEKVYRLALTMFQLLDVSKAEKLRNNLIDVFLPNLLGLTGGLTKKVANEVFRNYPSERKNAEQFLRSFQGARSTENLLHWLVADSAETQTHNR